VGKEKFPSFSSPLNVPPSCKIFALTFFIVSTGSVSSLNLKEQSAIYLPLMYN